jgi:ATP-dependent RNA helicase DeaD
MQFSDLSLPLVLKDALAERGYDSATPVQEKILDDACAGRDLLVSSRTGSGKTIAFGVASSKELLDDDGRAKTPHVPRVLVVAPTRELALQVARELQWLYRRANVRVTTCVGGMDIGREMRTLREGASIVVGTPGRLNDHLTRGSLDMSTIGGVVLDEADEMLDMGFRDELESILEAAPKERRTLLFSATLPKDIERIAKKFTVNPLRIEATMATEAHGDITTLAHLVAPREREHAVVNVLRFHDAASALVFCATREGVSRLSASLVERGFSAVGLSGEMSQAERNRAIQAMRDGRARVLVGTDVAARGLDLPAVALVIHADLPHDAAVLQHRSGRTGRAGRRGTAVILCPFAGRRRAESMFRQARLQGSWTSVPSSDEIRALDTDRVLLGVGALLTDPDVDDVEAGRALLEKYPPETIAAALVRIEKRAYPAPEELPLTLMVRGIAPHARDHLRRDVDEVQRGPMSPRRDDRPRLDERSEHAPPRGARDDIRRAPVDDEMRRPRAPKGGVWFHVNVGRSKNADPRWLLPLLCRRGNVEKRDIGNIEIEERETFFEVNPAAAERFFDAAKQPDKQDPGVRITLARPADAVTAPSDRDDKPPLRTPAKSASALTERPAPRTARAHIDDDEDDAPPLHAVKGVAAKTPAKERPATDMQTKMPFVKGPSSKGPPSKTQHAKGPPSKTPHAKGPASKGPPGKGPPGKGPPGKGPTGKGPTGKAPPGKGPTGKGPPTKGNGSTNDGSRPPKKKHRKG